MKLLFENWRKFIKESEDDSKSSAALKYLEDCEQKEINNGT